MYCAKCGPIYVRGTVSAVMMAARAHTLLWGKEHVVEWSEVKPNYDPSGTLLPVTYAVKDHLLIRLRK
jgi:hypothetical protein